MNIRLGYADIYIGYDYFILIKLVNDAYHSELSYLLVDNMELRSYWNRLSKQCLIGMNKRTDVSRHVNFLFRKLEDDEFLRFNFFHFPAKCVSLSNIDLVL